MKNIAFLEFVVAVALSAMGFAPAGCNGGSAGFAPGSTAANPCGEGGTCPNGQVCSPTLGCVQCITNGNCPTATPVCESTGQCVQCATNADCSGTTPACYPASHTCRAACSPDGGGARCMGGLMCDTATGACVGCVTSSDCPTTRSVCDSTTQACVQCETDANCSGATPRCRNSVCVACASNADCSGATPVCANDGTCGGGCVDNTQCTMPTAPVCDTRNNRCVECLADPDCAGRTGGADGGAPTPFCMTLGGGGVLNRCVECRPATADAGVQGCVAGQTCSFAGVCR